MIRRTCRSIAWLVVASMIGCATLPSISCAAQAHHASAPEQPCRAFVQSFYDWYIGHLNAQKGKQASVGSTYDVVRLRPQLLTPDLRRMLTEDFRSQRHSEEVTGLDFDPFLNAQDWEGKYTVENVTLSDDRCRASVWGTDGGKRREIVDPEAVLMGGRWVFVNFHYPGAASHDEENLVDLLKLLKRQRSGK